MHSFREACVPVCCLALLAAVISLTGCAFRNSRTSKSSDTVVYHSDERSSTKKKESPEAHHARSSESTGSSEVKSVSDKPTSSKTAISDSAENRKANFRSEKTAGTKGNRPSGPSDLKSDPDEEGEVREAALKLAQNCESPLNIKICYVTADREWWVSIYDDLGAQVDVKEYIWDKENQRLRPFLVLTRIPKNKLEDQLRKSGPDRVCFQLDPPKKNKAEKAGPQKDLPKP